MEDSLLYSLLSNELEIAGLRATYSNESSDISHTTTTSQTVPHKRHHSINMPKKQAEASYGPGSRSYTEPGLQRSLEAAADEAAGLWSSSYPASSLPAAVAPLSCSPPTGGQPSSSGGAVHQLKLLLASDSTVREAALKLLLQSSGVQQQQQGHVQGSLLQGTYRGRAPQLAGAPQHQQQQQDISMWGGEDGDDTFFGTDSSGLLRTAGSSSMLHISPQQSQHSGSPMHRSPEPPAGPMPAQPHAGREPAGQMPAQPHAGCAGAADEGIDDWVNLLEEQLLGCLSEQQAGTMTAAAAACSLHGLPAGALTSARSSSGTAAGLMPMQQQMHAHVQHQHLPPQRPLRHYHAAQQPPRPHAQHSGVQVQVPQQQQAYPHAGSSTPSRFSANILSTIDSITRTTLEGSRSPDLARCSTYNSPDLAGSASSSSNNNAAVLTGRAHSAYSNRSIGSTFHSQPLPMLTLQEGAGAAHGGVKRHNSIDQDQLLLSLLHEIVPNRR